MTVILLMFAWYLYLVLKNLFEFKKKRRHDKKEQTHMDKA